MTQIISEKLIEDVKGSIQQKNQQFLRKLIDEMRQVEDVNLSLMVAGPGYSPGSAVLFGAA